MALERRKRIVVTGCGMIGPLGCDTEIAWRRLLKGQSGIRRLSPDVSDGTGVAVAGLVPSVVEDPEAGYDPERFIPTKERKKMDRFIEFALMAAEEALTQAGWRPVDDDSQQRTATIIASGVGGFGAIADAVRTTDTRGPRRLSPFTAPSFSPIWLQAISRSDMVSGGRLARRSQHVRLACRRLAMRPGLSEAAKLISLFVGGRRPQSIALPWVLCRGACALHRVFGKPG